MRFLAPWMLLGALGALIPLLIHLFSRVRLRTERWGAMMFIRAALTERARRLRLEQASLLAARILIFALLAAALARPVFRGAAAETPGAPTTHVVIFDASASMGGAAGRGHAFARAKEAALALVDRMRPADNMLLVWGGAKPRALFPRPVFDKAYLRARIRELDAGIERMDAPQAFELAFWLLDHSTLPRRRVYLLTDGRRSGWSPESALRWDKLREHRLSLDIKPYVYVFEMAAAGPANRLALTGLSAGAPVVDARRRARFLVEAANYGREPVAARVRFLVDGAAAGERTVRLAPGSTTVDFDYAFPDPGSHTVSAEADGDDLGIDNRLDLAVDVAYSVQALLIEGTSSDDPAFADGGYLALALGTGGGRGEKGLIEVARRNHLDMDALDAEALGQYRAVILAGVGSLSAYFRGLIEEYVYDGGGLLICLGGNAAQEEYNRLAGGSRPIMPAEITGLRGAADRFFAVTLLPAAAAMGPGIESGERARVLDSVWVDRFWVCKPARGALVAAMADGAPMLVLGEAGAGRVALWTTSANADWTNLPLTPEFLPLAQSLVLHLAGGSAIPANVRQGEPLAYSHRRALAASGLTPAAAAERMAADAGAAARVRTPDGRWHTSALREKNGDLTMAWPDTLQPGPYTISVGDAPARCYAVRPDPGESDPAVLTPSDRERAAASLDAVFVSGYRQLLRRLAAEGGAREWWRPLLLCALAMMAAEAALARRFSR